MIGGFFALLWLIQIGQAAVTGVLPQAVGDAGWPNNPIYVLDLAFVVPLCMLTGIRLLRGHMRAACLAPALLVFIALLSVGVLSITAFAAIDGQPLALVDVAIFVVTTVAAADLAWITFSRGTPTQDLNKAAV